MNDRTHIDLFTGLGGFSLAAQACGYRTTLMCEIDPFLRAGLAKAFPGVPIHDDIRTLDGTKHRGADLLTAGVPCQPASCAGKRRGKDDVRWLWPEVIRVLAEARPRWALLENVAGLESVGLDGILVDVEGAGYEVGVLDIPACAINAPHRRRRLWIVAHAAQGRTERDDRAATSAERAAQNEAAGSIGRAERGTDGGGEVHVADAAEPGHQGTDTEPGQAGCGAEHRQGDVGYSERFGSGGRGKCEGHPTGTYRGDDRPVPWSNAVWVPCADGKLRRAPACPQCVANGLQPGISGALEGCGSKVEGPRKLLGALGNSIVWPLAAEIVRAMIQAED